MYRYIVCCNNVALGSYATMADALASIRMNDPWVVMNGNGIYREGVGIRGPITVVACRETSGPTPLYRERGGVSTHVAG